MDKEKSFGIALSDKDLEQVSGGWYYYYGDGPLDPVNPDTPPTDVSRCIHYIHIYDCQDIEGDQCGHYLPDLSICINCPFSHLK